MFQLLTVSASLRTPTWCRRANLAPPLPAAIPVSPSIRPHHCLCRRESLSWHLSPLGITLADLRVLIRSQPFPRVGDFAHVDWF
jgi:hypothetical protein